MTAIALDTNYAPGHAYYSEILNDAGKWTQGFSEAETALRLDPNLLEAHRAMGYAHESVGDYQAAIESLQERAQDQPEPDHALHAHRAATTARSPPTATNAIFYFSKANAIDPTNIEPYLYLSRTHYQNDELGTAIQYLEQAPGARPRQPRHPRPSRADPLQAPQLRRRRARAAPRRDWAARSTWLATRCLTTTASRCSTATATPLEVDRRQRSAAASPSCPWIGPRQRCEYYYTYGNLLAYLQLCDRRRGAPYYLQRRPAPGPDDPTVLGSFERKYGHLQRRH